MKIGIDARMYGPEHGGLGRYLEQLIHHLENLPTTDEFVIFLRADNWPRYTPRRDNFKKVLADIPWYGLKEQLKMPGLIKKEKVDLMHFPHWNIPWRYRAPFVVTIHDLILLHYPTPRASRLGPVKYWIKNLAFRVILRHATRAARHIIAPSEFTRADIIHTLKVDPRRVTVIPLAPAPIITATDGRTPRDLNITKPYLLYVGVAYPHKNLAGLIAAWKIFQKKYGTDYQLVLAGKNNYFYQRLKKEHPASDVIYTDLVTDMDLANLYRDGSLYVFPSFYEGFGLPPLEAMGYNLPVAAADAACLPEILQDACWYFPPGDPERMADIFHTALTDRETGQKLKQKSRDVLSSYRWSETATRTLAAYQAALANPNKV